MRVRNDCAAADDRLTGVALEAASNATNDTNGKLIVASTGLTGTTTQTITVVVSQNAAPGGPRQSVPHQQVGIRSWSDQ